MKIETNNKAENFGHKKFEFRIDEKHQFKAIWALINLYQNKIGTPVQEIISNARDAHREVGKPDHTFKVNVTENEFTCRDYGSGIDPDKAQHVFCSIGESTKTGDNKQTGGFGIGAKSPLAYVNSFTIKSYVDGKEYIYIIAKNGEILEMNLISTKDTKEVNGTLVIIPIKKNNNRGYNYTSKKYEDYGDSKKFIEAVRKTCAFWDAKPTFNHKHAQIDVMELKTVSNGKLYAKNDLFNHDLAVVDGIPYKAGYRYNNFNTVMFFNTGDIRLHETRERLADNNEDNVYNSTLIEVKTKEIENDLYNINQYIDKNDLFNSFKNLSKFGVNFNYEHKDIRFRNRFITKNKGEFSTYNSQLTGRYPYTLRYKKESSSKVNYESEYFYNDIDDSMQKISRRVKNYVNVNYVDNKKEHTVIVLDKDSGLVKLMNAKKVSTLEIPKIVRNGVKKKSEELTITYLNQYGQDRCYTKSDNIVTKHLYLDFKQDLNVAEVYFFLKKRGYRLCRLSKDSIAEIQGNENFIDYNKFVSELHLTRPEKLFTYDHLSQPRRITVKGVILDKKIENLLERNSRYLDLDGSGHLIPKSFWNLEILKEAEKIKANNEEILKLYTYTREEYKLLTNDRELNTEYVNAVYKYRNV